MRALRGNKRLAAGAAAMVTLGAAAMSLVWARDMLLVHKIEAARQMAEMALGVADKFRSDSLGGQMTEDEAKSRAIEVLGAMTYSPHGYIWVADGKTIICHPLKSLVGHPGVKDGDGREIVPILNHAAISGSETATYSWPKPDGSGTSLKTSGVVRYIPWGWTIGSGVWIDDVNESFVKANGKIAASLFALAALMLGWLLFAEGERRAERHARTMRDAKDTLSLLAHACPNGNGGSGCGCGHCGK